MRSQRGGVTSRPGEAGRGSGWAVCCRGASGAGAQADMMIREPVKAGSFYPGAADACSAAAAKYCRLEPADRPSAGTVIGGVVPHAGWMCSGRVAGRVFAAMRSEPVPQTIVLLGAMHRVLGRRGVVFASGQWRTPSGTVDVDEELAGLLLDQSEHVLEDRSVHQDEHSLEVQVPFVQQVFPGCRILPILVPPVAVAPLIGEAAALAAEKCDCPVLVVASTDLTHYGPVYGFTPQGSGEGALAWAKDVNDRRVIDLVLAMKADAIVPEVAAHRNACGAGALAAAVAATKRMGATRGILLEHTTSREVLADRGFDGAVGYAGIVFV